MALKARDATTSLFVGLGWLVVVAGAALRLWHAGAKSLWYDEVNSIGVASFSWGGVIGALRGGTKFYPPGFPYLLKLWMLAGTSDAWVKTLPALLGAGVVALTWVWARQLFDVRVAFVATFLTACSTYEIYFAQELRMYVLLAFVALASWVFLMQAVATNRNAWWALWAVSTSLCMYSFYFGAFFIVGEAVWLLLLAAFRPELRRPVLLWSTVSFVIFLPWLPSAIKQWHDGGSRAWISSPASLSTIDRAITIFCAYTIGNHVNWQTRILSHVRDLMAVLFFLGLIAGNSASSAQAQTLPPVSLRGRFKHSWLGSALEHLGRAMGEEQQQRWLLFLLIAFGVLGPIVCSMVVQPFYDVRYVLFAAVPFYLLIARGLVRGMEYCLALVNWQKRFLRWQAVVLLAIMAGYAFVNAYPMKELYSDWEFGQADFQDATAFVLQHYQPNDVVVHDHQFSWLPMLWYAYRDHGPGPYTNVSFIPAVPDAWLVHAPMKQIWGSDTFLSSWLPQGNGRLWLVSRTNYTASHPNTDVSSIVSFHPPEPAWHLVSNTFFEGVRVRLFAHQ